MLSYPHINSINKEKEKKNQKKKEKPLLLLVFSLLKIGHFYFATNRTFLLCLDMA